MIWLGVCSFDFQILFMFWSFAHMSGFGYYILWMYLWVDEMATWGVCYISAVMFYCWNIYACHLRVIWRRDVYFLNIYIRVLYRFNRSRTLQVGIRAMSVLSEPKPSELLVIFEWYFELASILVVLFCWLFFPLYATCTEVLSVLVMVFRSFRRVWAEWKSNGIL